MEIPLTLHSVTIPFKTTERVTGDSMLAVANAKKINDYLINECSCFQSLIEAVIET